MISLFVFAGQESKAEIISCLAGGSSGDSEHQYEAIQEENNEGTDRSLHFNYPTL